MDLFKSSWLGCTLVTAVVSAGCQRASEQGGTAAPAESAQSPAAATADEEEFFNEDLPPHLQAQTARADETLSLGESGLVARGVINRLKQWPPEVRTLRVCFFGGRADLRKRIIDVANRWMAQPVGLSFDFGTAPNFRDCISSGDDHVRVGFREAGYWSLVGQDSYERAGQMQQSLNLHTRFKYDPPREPSFSRYVLHEFGHALGFEHEHQHPWSGCEAQFNWDAIRADLSGPPNNWNDAEINYNMRQLSADDLTLTTFDPQSIMLYTFPASYYKPGATCYHETNYTLSTGDFSLLARTYPVDVQQHSQLRLEAVRSYITEVAKQKPGRSQNVDALRELVKLTQGSLPKEATQGIPASDVAKELNNPRAMQ
jgi:hypothetical protein